MYMTYEWIVFMYLVNEDYIINILNLAVLSNHIQLSTGTA